VTREQKAKAMNGAHHTKTTRRMRLGLTLAGVGAAVAMVAALGFRNVPADTAPRGSESVEKAARAAPARESRATRLASVEESRARTPTPKEEAPAEEPIRVPELENPVLAATQARRFSNEEEELAFWTERIRGERLTLENREQSLKQAERVLESRASLGEAGVRELERRKALIDAKHAAQTRYVAEIEQRISELTRNQR
jgi:hypothetical protein